MVVLSVFFQGVPLSGFFTIQGQAIFADGIERDVFRFREVSLSNELFQAIGIIFQCPQRTAHFDFQVVKETLCLFLEGSGGFLKGGMHRADNEKSDLHIG